jgi:hypothetical protein
MVPVMSLWLPILVSAVIVFVGSSVIHMVLTYHRNDFKKIPNEDDALEALRRLNIPPGDYGVPCAQSPDQMRRPEFQAKMKTGPIVFMTVMAGGSASLGKSLVFWFIYSLLVGLFSGYIASRALAPGADYLNVFQFVGTSAFMGYSFALLQWSIWYHRNWGTTIKSVADGLFYALLTAGTFGWLWPR